MRSLWPRLAAVLLACACGSPPPPPIPPVPPAPSAAPPPATPAPTAVAPPQEPTPSPGGEPPPVFPADRRERLVSALDAVDALAAEGFRKYGAPALAAGLVIDGELVWSKGYGSRNLGANQPVDADTVFRIGSITKTVTSMTAALLVDRGVLDLDAPAARYLPELDRVTYPTRDSARITMRHLLTHESGLPRLGPIPYTDPDKVATEQEFLDALTGLRLRRAPDTKVVYSNLGFGLAGIALGRIAGKPFRDLVTTEILRPLGMTSTVWDESAVPPGRLATGYRMVKGKLAAQRHWRLGPIESAGGLYASVRDMSRYAAAHLDAWPPRDTTESGVVRRSSLRETHTATRTQGVVAKAPSAGPAGKGKATDQLTVSARSIGLGWQVLETCELQHVVWHNGGTEGYASALYLMPQHGVGVILLSSGRAELDVLAVDILMRLDQTGGLVTRQPQANDKLRAAMLALASLLRGWDRAQYDALFASSFKEDVTAEMFEMSVASMAARHGACRFERVLSVEGPGQGDFELSCDRGRLVVGITLGDDPAAQIVGARVESPEERDAEDAASKGGVRCQR